MRVYLIALVLAACGSGDSSGSLVGSWRVDNPSSGTVVWTFRTDGAWIQHAEDHSATTGCTTTREVTGSYSTNGSSLSTTPVSATIANAGCTDSSKNIPTQNDSGFPMNIPTTVQTYAISGSILTLTSQNGGMMTFTRQ